MLPNDYPSLKFKTDAELICNYLLKLRNSDVEISVQSFQRLLIEGISCPESEVLYALNQIVNSEWAETEFTNFLNRCCYILINHWWSKSEFTWATDDLVNLFRDPPPVVSSTSVNTQKLRYLIHQFTQTPQYQTLERYAQVAKKSNRPEKPPNHDETSERMENLIYRYPFLYRYFLLDGNSGELGHHAVRRRQLEMEQQFENCLWHYAPGLFQTTTNTAEVKNPTLLSDQNLKLAIAQFAGKSEGGSNYQDASQQFLVKAGQSQSFRFLKQEIYTYLTDSIKYSCKPNYGNHSFNDWLQEQLKHILPESDEVQPTGQLLIQTCDQLIATLLADPTQVHKHSMFLDLHGNLGATFTIGFLLKIVLICCTVKSNLKYIKDKLAQRFSVILRHYEATFRKDVEWLAECLDNWMIAHTIHFGRWGFSKWSKLL